MAEPTEKPSLAEAIEWGRSLFFIHKEKDKIALRDRLVEAGEFEQRNGSKAFDCYSARWQIRPDECPIKAEKDRRIEKLEEKLRGRGQTIKAMEICREHGLDKDEEVKRLRSQLDAVLGGKLSELIADYEEKLAEKERELDKKDRRYEKMDEGYSHQIASLSIEIERLEDELDDLRLSTTPGFIEAMGLIDEGLTKGKLEIEKVRKVTKLLPDDEPTKPDSLEKAKPSDKGTFEMVVRRFQELEFRLEQIEEQIWPKPKESQ